MAAINTLDWSVFMIGFGNRPGYLLPIGWLCPKINTLQDIAIYYYVLKWHMAAINTLDWGVFTRCFGYWMGIGWLCPNINTLQDIVTVKPAKKATSDDRPPLL